MINSDWLQSFAVFADTLNFTRAAKQLHISQPALHVQIRKLGEELGVALYVRNGRVLTLTTAGQRVLAFARDQRERTARLMEEVSGSADLQTVVLAAGEGSFLYLLGGALRAFQGGKHGRLEVLTRDRDGAVSAVRLGEAHLAVTVSDEVPAELTARKLLRNRMLRTFPCATHSAIGLAARDDTRGGDSGAGNDSCGSLAAARSA